VLNALKTSCIAKESTLLYNETNERLLDTAISSEQVPPEMKNRKFFCSFIYGDSFTTNTLLFQKYIKDSQI
jgi:hypothetical protein